MNNYFIILASGQSKRFNSKKPKQFNIYKNKALFKHSLEKAMKSKLFKKIILVVNNKKSIIREYKFLISLKKNRNRKSENKSIAEGYRENSNLIDSSLNVDTLYICPELFVGENNEELIRKFENKNIRIVQVALKVFKEISYRDKPDGIISIFDVNKNKLPKTISGPILIPDQIEKPGNLGTMIRTSKSFGINNILLSDEITDVYNPNVIRASIGHLFDSNISSGSNDEIISLLEANDYQVLLLDPEGDESLEGFIPNQNFALVVGAEQYGISDNWFNSNYTSLFIRSTNNVDSINASTAAAIAMWELTK